jgi:hypothetical protein
MVQSHISIRAKGHEVCDRAGTAMDWPFCMALSRSFVVGALHVNSKAPTAYCPKKKPYDFEIQLQKAQTLQSMLFENTFFPNYL